VNPGLLQRLLNLVPSCSNTPYRKSQNEAFGHTGTPIAANLVHRSDVFGVCNLRLPLPL
jgi:hypothetical protein